MKQRAVSVCEGIEVTERTQQVGHDGVGHLGMSAPIGSVVGFQE